MNTAAFTEADVTELAALVGPHLDRLLTGIDPMVALELAVDAARRQNTEDFARRTNMAYILTDALSGTRDEIRAEASEAIR